MSSYRFAPLPSNASVAAGVTVAVSAWLTLAAGTILADPTQPQAADARQRAVLMEEAAPAYPTPLPVAANAALVTAKPSPVMCEKIVVEAQRARA